MPAPVEVPVPSLAPLQKGTAVRVLDIWDGNKPKTAYVLEKVHPGMAIFDPFVNKYVVTFGGPLSLEVYVNEAFLPTGDVLPTDQWKLRTMAQRVRARQLEKAVKAAANP